MILFPYAGETQGGSIHSSYLLIEELQRRGHRVLVAFHGSGHARDLARQKGFPYVDLPPLGAKSEMTRQDKFRLGNLKPAIRCHQLIREHSIDLVHVNDKRMLRTWAAPALSSGRSLLVHWRSIYGRPSLSIDLGLRLASQIVCVSAYSRDLLPPWAQAKSTVVYNPFEPGLDLGTREIARKRIREMNGIPADAAVIGFFGNLLARKRPHILLQLLQRLTATADGRAIYGVVCGETVEPRDEVFFQMLDAEDWGARVVLAGLVPNVAEWMAACDVMILPAIDEPLARVGVEAQSVGLPALVSSDGGLREVVEHGVSGLVLDPHDFDAWLRAVREVLDDRDLSRKLSDGGVRAAAELSVARHAEAMEETYEKFGLMAAHRRAAP